LKYLGLGALAIILAAVPLPAQTAPTKVAILNIQGAIITTNDGAKAREALAAKFGGRTKEIEARTAEVGKLREQYSKGSNTMAAEAREKLSREIDDKQKKLQWDTEDLNNEMEQEQAKFVNEIGQRIMQIVDEYAKAQGFALVLDVSTQQSPVLWAASGVEITMTMVDLYDKKYGGPAKPAAAGAAKPGAPAAGGAKPAAPATKK
jgi:outer membrane protein